MSRFSLIFIVSWVLLAPVAIPTQAQEYTSAADRLAWYKKHTEMKEHSPHKNLKWQFLGPTNISGRVTDVAVTTPRSNTYSIYAATASGGVWKLRMKGRLGSQFLNMASRLQLATLRLLLPIRILSGLDWERRTCFDLQWRVPVFINQSMRDRHGNTWAWQRLIRFLELSFTQRTRTSSTSLTLGMSGPKILNGVFIKLWMAAKPGRKVLELDEQTGVIDLMMDPGIPRLFTQRLGSGLENAGTIPAMKRITPGAGFIRLLMEGRPGNRSTRVCRRLSFAGGLELICV